MPNHSLIFFCLVPFWVSHLKEQERPRVKLSAQAPSLRSHVGDLCSHQVLFPDFAELHEIWLQAVHLLVDLSVIRHLLSQILLQLSLAVVNLFHA